MQNQAQASTSQSGEHQSGEHQSDTAQDSTPPPPSAPALAPAADSGAVGDAITRATQPVLVGDAEPGTTVALHEGAATLGTATADPAGRWMLAPVVPLLDGVHDLTVTAADAAGNASARSLPLRLTIDTQAAVPTSIALTPASDSGLRGDQITNAARPVVAGSAEPGSAVTLRDGTLRVGTATAGSSGAWSIVLPAGLRDGLHRLTATATDPAGNVSPTSRTLFLTLDATAPPSPTIGLALPETGHQTRMSTPTLAGTAEPGASVTLFEAGVALGTTTADAGGRWSITSAARLANGEHRLTAVAADTAGNASAPSAGFAVVVDTVPPAAPYGLSLAPAGDSGRVGDRLTSQARPVISGYAAPGDRVTLVEGVVPLGAATADAAGLWTIAPAADLREGVHALAAFATDGAGNVSPASAPLVLTRDAAAPAPPSILDPGMGSLRQGVASIAGAAEPGSTVVLFDGALTLGSTVADPAGGWTITPAAALTDGPHRLQAQATDAAGNASALSAALGLTIDSIAPAPPSPPALLAPAGTAGLTNLVRPAVGGTAEPGSTVVLFDGALVVGSTVADPAGGWTITSAAALADGPHRLQAQATDAAGNASRLSAATGFTIDSIAPAPPSAPELARSSDSGTPGDNVTNVLRPTFTGAATPGAVIALQDGASPIGRTTADATTGIWSLTAIEPLAPGIHRLAATATDLAGNVSASSAPLLLTLQTSPPPVPSAPALAAASDTGRLGDAITGAARPVLSGSAGAGSLVSVTEAGTVLATAVADAGGQWTVAIPLQDGTHGLTTTATDAAGNVSAASASVLLTIDTAAPVQPAAPTLDPSTDSGIVGDRTTNVVRPTLTGTAEPGSTVALRSGGTFLGVTLADARTGAWTFTAPAPLAPGLLDLTATATDAAGNVSAASPALQLTIATAPPAVTAALANDTGTPGDGITADPSLAGSAPPGAAVVVSEGGQALGTILADSAGRWQFTPVSVTDGAHTVVAAVTDSAGNTGSATVRFFAGRAVAPAVFAVTDAAGTQLDGVVSAYRGSVPVLQWQFIHAGPGGATISATADNAFIAGGIGNDAIVAQNGRNILDGQGGSDWLVGGAGQDSFILDARGRTWSTIVGFGPGDDASIRGLTRAASTFHWEAARGRDGYQGATLVGTTDGGSEVFAVTFAGLGLQAAKQLSAVFEQGSDGIPVLRLQAATPAQAIDATYAITDVTTGVLSVGLLDAYAGAAAGLRYQHLHGDAPVALVSRASDTLLRSGGGNDALAVQNGDNVLDGGGGSNWLMGGAGSDRFFVDVRGPVSAWNTILNFHAGDSLTIRGAAEAVSAWGWSAAANGAAGYTGATLAGVSGPENTPFAITFAGVSVEQGRGFTVGGTLAEDGSAALLVRA